MRSALGLVATTNQGWRPLGAWQRSWAVAAACRGWCGEMAGAVSSIGWPGGDAGDPACCGKLSAVEVAGLIAPWRDDFAHFVRGER